MGREYKRNTKPGPRAVQIIEYLQTHGPAVSVDVADVLGMARNTAATIMHSMAEECYSRPQLIHVARWTMTTQAGDARPYPRPVFAAGPGPNAVRDHYRSAFASYRKKYQRRKAPAPVVVARRSPASIFELGAQMVRDKQAAARRRLRSDGPAAC